jgi:bacteriocin-like protein
MATKAPVPVAIRLRQSTGSMAGDASGLDGEATMNNLDRRDLAEIELHVVSGGDNKESIEITEDELKQVTGGTSKLPAMNKAPDVTLKRGTI